MNQEKLYAILAEDEGIVSAVIDGQAMPMVFLDRVLAERFWSNIKTPKKALRLVVFSNPVVVDSRTVSGALG
jgi:hypothetical protein